MVKTLLLSDLHSLNCNVSPELLQVKEFIVDLIDMFALNRPLALWTAHEGKLDSKGRPLVLEQLNHAVCMEDMSALKANTWFLPQLTGITDLAEVFLRWQVCTAYASWIQAWQTLLLVQDASAPMATLFFHVAPIEATLFKPFNLSLDRCLILMSLLFVSSVRLATLIKFNANFGHVDHCVFKHTLYLLLNRIEIHWTFFDCNRVVIVKICRQLYLPVTFLFLILLVDRCRRYCFDHYFY